MRKAGLVTLTVMLALALAGLGYAAWTETIAASGTVNTGEVDVEFLVQERYQYPDGKYYDGSWDKQGENDPDWFNGGQGPDYGSTTPEGPRGTSARLDRDVAMTTYEPVDTDGDGDIDQLRVTLHNAYPGYVGGMTFRIKNNGSIPVKFNVLFDANEGAPLGVGVIGFSDGRLLEPGQEAKLACGAVVGSAEDPWTGEDAGEGQTYTFTVSFEATQWNLYQAP